MATTLDFEPLMYAHPSTQTSFSSLVSHTMVRRHEHTMGSKYNGRMHIHLGILRTFVWDSHSSILQSL